MKNARKLKVDLDAVTQQEQSDQFMSACAGSSVLTDDDGIPNPTASASYTQQPVNTLVRYFQRVLPGPPTTEQPVRRRITKKSKP